MAAGQRSDYSDEDVRGYNHDSDQCSRVSPASSPLAAFCEFISSPNWLYPTARFFGHALYEYYYDIDFIDCADQEDVQKRNTILYESYRDLVGSLMVMFCKEYHVQPAKVIEIILTMNGTMEHRSLNESIFNLLRAAFGMDHFGYIIMSYCSLFKVKCCEDVAKYISQTKVTDSKKQSWEQLWRYLHEVMKTIAEKHLRVEKFLSSCKEKVNDGIKLGPYISYYGISMYDPCYEYGARLDRMLSLISKAAFARLKLDEFTDPADIHCNSGDSNETQDEDLSKRVNTTKVVYSDLPSGLGLGLIPSSNTCFRKFEEEDLQESTSSCSASSRNPNIDSKSAKNCTSQKNSPVSPSSKKVKSTLSSESSRSAVINESKKTTHLYKTVTDSDRLLSSTLDYDQFKSTFPTNEKTRQEYLLHEYDRRLNMQVAYQAANFELHDALLINNKQFRALICEQRRFERKWPLLRTKSKLGNESQMLHDESTPTTTVDEKEACFIKVTKEGQAIIDVVQYGVDMDVLYT